MPALIDLGVVLVGYLLGSIPFGLIWVKLITGKDIRHIASGRTGGTNAARAAGPGAGILTALMDGAKGVAAVWIAVALSPDSHWIHVLAPVAAIVGHNYSVFLIERQANRRVRFRGGAGGAPTVGGAIGLWWPTALIVMPIALLVFFGVGYASVTTLSVALSILAIFAIRYAMRLATFPDVVYGAIALFLLLWALRPNLKALASGQERFHGWRPWRGSRPLFPAHGDSQAGSRERTAPPHKSKQMRKSRRAKSVPARR